MQESTGMRTSLLPAVAAASVLSLASCGGSASTATTENCDRDSDGFADIDV
jgi:hypothetical protein